MMSNSTSITEMKKEEKRQQKRDEEGLHLLTLLLQCAEEVSADKFEEANKIYVDGHVISYVDGHVMTYVDGHVSTVNEVLVLSGHDHDQCTVTHMSKYGPIIEHTVGTISWQQGNLYPSFMLLSAANDTLQNDSSLQDAVSTQLCFLPMQTHIYIWYLSQFAFTLLIILVWPTNGLGFWSYSRGFMMYTRSLMSSDIFKSGVKGKNEDENSEYEMMWDADGSIHLVKKTSDALLTHSSERSLSERGNAVMRSTAKRHLFQKMDMDVEMDVELDMMAKLPTKASKSRTKKVIRRLIRTLRMLTIIAAVNVPLYMMLLFKDWTE